MLLTPSDGKLEPRFNLQDVLKVKRKFQTQGIMSKAIIKTKPRKDKKFKY